MLIAQGKNTLCRMRESNYWRISVFGFEVFDYGKRYTLQRGHAHDDR